MRVIIQCHEQMRDDLYRMNRLDNDIQQYSFSDIDLIKLVNMKNMSALFFGVCKCMCLCMLVLQVLLLGYLSFELLAVYLIALVHFSVSMWVFKLDFSTVLPALFVPQCFTLYNYLIMIYIIYIMLSPVKVQVVPQAVRLLMLLQPDPKQVSTTRSSPPCFSNSPSAPTASLLAASTLNITCRKSRMWRRNWILERKTTVSGCQCPAILSGMIKLCHKQTRCTFQNNSHI